MSSPKLALPVKSRSFVKSAKNLLSLSTDELQKLLDALELKKTLFSNALVANLLQRDVAFSEDVRMTLLYILHQIDSHNIRLEQIEKELVDIGCERANVEHLTKSVSRLGKESLSAASLLIDIYGYVARIDHLKTLGLQINYTNIESSKNGHLVMFPLIRITVVTRGREETKETSFDLDAASLQTFILRLQKLLGTVLAESVSLKSALGERYTSLIGD